MNDNKNAWCNLQMAHVFNSFSNKNNLYIYTKDLINIYFGTLNYSLSGINFVGRQKDEKQSKKEFY